MNIKELVNLIKIQTLPVTPISNLFGIDRGKAIDRVYVEEFMSNHAALIRGTVVEIGDDNYTRQFGQNNVEKSLILQLDGVGDNVLIANLETGEGVLPDVCDCIILPQTLPFIANASIAVANVFKMLKPNGVMLTSLSGITPVSRYDMDRWGHYCNYTDMGLKCLLSPYFNESNTEIYSYGNVKTATAFLYGLAAHELNKEDFKYHDKNYQVSICAKAIKSCI